MKDYVIFIANNWGTSNGGINTFNYDLSRAVAKRRDKREQITICLLLHSVNDIERKNVEKEFGLKLVSLLDECEDSYENTNLTPDFLKGLNKLLKFRQGNRLIWIGHDIKTGRYANICKREYGGKSLVFNHMNFPEYYFLATGDEEKANEKEALQRDILQEADWIFAVGPSLKDYAEDIRTNAGKNSVIEFIPGMLEVEPVLKPSNTHKIIFFGRIDNKNNYIKQPKLAIAAFSYAYSEDKKNNTGIFRNNPRMLVLGYPEITKKDKDILKNLVEKYSSETLNIMPKKYLSIRSELIKELRSCSLCIMVSRHEGFGLAAYEAISAGVPVIISDNSGLDRFLKDKEASCIIRV